MKKVAVFGKPANGKSTLSKALSAATGIPLHAVDSMLYLTNGDEIDRDEYNALHDDILNSERWIIEGFAPLSSLDSFYKRLDEADTLIYIDLPYSITYWLVAKRFFKGLFVTPEGWPAGSSVLQGTLQSFKVLKLCPKFWNEAFLHRLQKQSDEKSLHVITSLNELNNFVQEQAQ